MTDSILRSYQRYTYTSIIPFEAPPPPEGALLLLQNETDGFAFDATTYDSITAAAYEGALVGGTVAVKDTVTPANNLSNVALDNSIIANTTTSPKMVHWDSTPYVRWAPHNYALQSQTLSNAAWTATAITVTDNDTTAPDSTVTADKLVESNTSTSVLRATSAITVVSSFVYSYSFYIDPSNITWIALTVANNSTDTNGVRGWFNVSTGATGTLSNIGTGWTGITSTIAAAGAFYRCTITFSTGATTLFPSIFSATADAGTTRVTSGTYWAWGAVLNRGLQAVAYMATTTAARFGISQEWDPKSSQYALNKESSINTNYIAASEDFASASWTKTDITLSAASAPDGSSNASLCTEGTAGTAVLTQIAFAVARTDHPSCLGFYLKRGNTDWVRMEIIDQTSPTHGVVGWFNLNTGAVGTVTYNGTAHSNSGTLGVNIIDIGGGWYRCLLGAIVRTTNDFSCTVQLSSASADASTTRVNNATYTVWGAEYDNRQIMRWCGAYIQTIGGGSARVRDTILVTSGLPTFTAHTNFVEFRMMSHGDNVVYSLDTGVSSVNNSGMYSDGGGNFQHGFVYSASVNNADQQGPQAYDNTVASGYNKGAHRVQLNDVVHYCNGVGRTVDTACPLPVGTLNRLQWCGTDGHDHVFKSILYCRALDNTELDTITT